MNTEDRNGFLFNALIEKTNSYFYKAAVAIIAVVTTIIYNNIRQQNEYINDVTSNISNTVNNTITNIKVHGNSKQSKKPKHGYKIYNKSTGDVVKVGISSEKIRLDGKSYRAEKQVRAFNRIEKGEKYDSRIMGYFPDRQSALSWEVLNSQYRYVQGHSMRFHILPRFDNWYLNMK